MGKSKVRSKIQVQFGIRVRALRQGVGLSQMELGRRADLDHTYVGGIERGERNLSIEAIEKVANGLEIEIVQLFQHSSQRSAESQQIAELVALLERKDEKTIKRVLDMVRLALEM